MNARREGVPPTVHNLFQPSLGDEELDAVRAVFAANWPGHGPRTTAFEAEFAARLAVPADQVVFTNSATAAMFLATELLGLGPADDVVLPSISSVGAANVICASGARPMFCDVDPHTLNPSVADVERALTPRTRAVLIPHYGGHPGHVTEIAGRCRDRGLLVVEDAASAISSTVDGQMCGTFGDIAVWGFDATNIVVTGDGGMLYVHDPDLARRARKLACHGLRHASGLAASTQVPRRWWEPDVTEFGRSVAGNDLAAAIGSVQLRRLPEFIARRETIVRTYDRLLTGVDCVVTPPELPVGQTGSHHFYWVQLDAGIRDQVAADLLERDIYTSFRYPPLHKVAAYRSNASLPGTDDAAERTLLLPIHQALDDTDVRTIAAELCKSIEHRAWS
jgi:dTDP-4-dehydro-2,3,6-trideoxy-D-glucose 4-aminotransferase